MFKKPWLFAYLQTLWSTWSELYGIDESLELKTSDVKMTGTEVNEPNEILKKENWSYESRNNEKISFSLNEYVRVLREE